MAQYYSQFFPNWTETVKPLRDLFHEGDINIWSPEQERTFTYIKEMLTRDPKMSKDCILMLPDVNKQYVLDADASKYAIGGVLQQYDQKGELRPIMYISRKLTKAEQNYCTRQREALAVVWAFIRLREYLWGSQDIIVRTDHQNLLWLMNNDYTGRLARWQALLSCYDFEIRYLPGKTNIVADSLSRINYTTPSACIAAMQQMDEFEDLALNPDMKNILPANMIFYIPKIHAGTSKKDPAKIEALRKNIQDLKTLQIQRDLNQIKCCIAHFTEEGLQNLKEYEEDKAVLKDNDRLEHECYCCQAHSAVLPQNLESDQTSNQEKMVDESQITGEQPNSTPNIGVGVEDGSVRIASIEAWRQAQRMDEEYKNLIQYFTNGRNELELTDAIKQQLKFLEWKDGLLWYKGKSEKTSNNPSKWTLWVRYHPNYET